MPTLMRVIDSIRPVFVFMSRFLRASGPKTEKNRPTRKAGAKLRHVVHKQPFPDAPVRRAGNPEAVVLAVSIRPFLTGDLA